jgi:hypothetical protein
MNNPLVSTLLLVGLPLLVGLGGYTLLRRRGTRSGTAGCGALLLALVVCGLFTGVMILSALR